MLMRVCFVSNEYPPFTVGGAGTYAFHISKGLTMLGHEIHVISPSINTKETYSVEDGVFVHRVPMLHKRFLSGPSFWFGLTKKYNEMCRDVGRFDVLHSNDTSGLSILNWRLKEPKVVTVHHLASTVAAHMSFSERIQDIRREGGLVGPIFERHAVNRANKIIAVSNFTKADLVSTYNIPPSRIDVVHNGVCPEDFTSTKEEVVRARTFLHSENATMFLFVGRIDDKRKGLSLLLEAWRVLSKKEESAKLVVVGPGDQTRARVLANSLDITESIIFCGRVGDQLLRKIYCACDVFVSPSLFEGFGLNLVEAMAAGKPIIAFNLGAVSEILTNGFNGRVLCRRDPVELAESMSSFIRDPDLAKEIGDYNRDYVSKRFNWRTAAKSTAQAYESARDLKTA